MDFDDDFFNEYESDPVRRFSDFSLSNEMNRVDKNHDPFNLHDPLSSYLFLSDDVQDELKNDQQRKMKCSSCGYEFLGQIGGYCPKCYSSELSEI